MDNEQKNLKSQKMRNMPMGRLILSMSLPAVFSMFIKSMYNIVDTMYISRFDVGSDNMIKALGYAFPMQMIMMSIAFGIGIGSNILISRKLGERKHEEASNVAKTGLLMGLIFGVIFFACSFFIPKLFLNIMSNIELIREYGTQYLSIVMMFGITICIEVYCEKMLQGMGRMMIPMISQLIGALTNIALDPIFIFTLNMGVKGAAIATVIGQATAMGFLLAYVLIKKLDISLSFMKFKFKMQYVKEITLAGLPAMIMNSISSFTNILLNGILKGLDNTETANGVLTLYFKLSSFVFMPVFGLTHGGLPILSYNYGANNKERFKKGLVILFTTAFITMLIGFVVFQVFPRQLLEVLKPEEVTITSGIPALRIISYCFLPAAFGIIMVTAYQAINHGGYALAMSLLRQAVLLVPFAYIVSRYIGVSGVWYSYIIAEGACVVLFFPILLILIKKSFALKNIDEMEVKKC